MLYGGMTPLAIIASDCHHVPASVPRVRRCVAVLLEAGAKPDVRDYKRYTALMYAARHRHTYISAMLLAAGADVTARADNGYTALHAAVECGRVPSIILLISAGAVVDAVASIREMDQSYPWTRTVRHETPLDTAIRRNYSLRLEPSSRGRHCRLYHLLLRAGARMPPNPPGLYLKQVVAVGGFHAHALAHRERLRAIFVPKFRLPKYLVYHVLDYWAHFGCYYTADPVEAGKKNKIKDKERRKKKNVKSKSKKKGRNFSKL